MERWYLKGEVGVLSDGFVNQAAGSLKATLQGWWDVLVVVVGDCSRGVVRQARCRGWVLCM